MTMTDREKALAKRAGKGGAAWIEARRKSPGLTLREFQLRGEIDESETTAPAAPAKKTTAKKTAAKKKASGSPAPK